MQLCRQTVPFLLMATLPLTCACSGGQPVRAAAASYRPTPPAATPPVSAPAATAASPPTQGPFDVPLSAPSVMRGSDPSALPGPILIADRANNRLLVVNPAGAVVWEFPRPGDLYPGQTFRVPDDAFFTPDGRQIIATQEDNFVISLIDVVTHRIVYRYGHPGVPGSAAGYLNNPDDAMVLAGGEILSADIKNCRVIVIPPGGRQPSRVLGTSGVCWHHPPHYWASPNGVFPMASGHYVVTEIGGDWVNEIDLRGNVYRSWHPPGIAYPSDTNEVRPGVFVTVGYSTPGVLETFDSAGRLLWRYRPLPGDPPLDHPSLALPLPNGDFLMNDDYNDRVVVIDPRTNRVVWQYGHTWIGGKRPGYLLQPDGVDLAPPHSLLMQFAPH